MKEIDSFTPAGLLTAEKNTASRITPPGPIVLMCSGCTCIEPCRIAQIASNLQHGEDVAHYKLGDILDFSVSQKAIEELKGHIALTLKALSIYQANRLLKRLAILPSPSSYTLATTGDNYAVIFVVGKDHATHPVVVPSEDSL